MKPETQTRNHHLTIILALVTTLFTLGCGQFCAGIIWQIEDLWPIYPPKPNRADAKLLGNGLTIAEAANTGRHRYSKEARVRNGLFGVNMAESPVITHTFAGEEVTLSSGSGPGKVYSRIAPNTYRGKLTGLSKCSPVEMTLIYNRDGFARFYECPTRRKLQALISYTLIEEKD